MLAALEVVLAPRVIVLRNDTPARALEGLDTHVRAVKGEIPARLALEENGMRYFADLGQGQKTGWYYDQRDNRAFMAGLAKGRSVLDAYSYAGGFALKAAQAGAREVVALDSSAPALALGEEAAAANKLSARIRFVKADVFEELERLAAAGETFDVVIADPPPFVKARKDLEPGAKAYRKLARLAAAVTAPGGFLLLASCSHNMPPDRFALECAIGIARAGRQAALLRQAGAAPDHPVHPMLLETAYLKTSGLRAGLDCRSGGRRCSGCNFAILGVQLCRAPPTSQRFHVVTHRSGCHQGSRSHAHLLDHQDRGDDPGRDRRRHRHHDDGTGAISLGTAIFLSLLVGLVIWQTAAKKFHPFLYWATIVASTTAGTTLADFADRSLGHRICRRLDRPAARSDRNAGGLGTGRWARSRWTR